MQYSPKLKKAMEEIKSILKRHDIGGYVILHTPGHSEYLHSLFPSYSCIKPVGDEIRIRARLKEDFNGDKDAMIKKLEDTVNLVSLIATVSGNTSLSMCDLMDRLHKVMDIDETDGGHTSHTTQNN